jgi:iron complex transport system substrate-binding protein
MRPQRTQKQLSVLAASMAVLLAGCAGAPAPSATPSGTSAAATTAAAQFPVTAKSCGFSAEITKAPSRAVTLNQGATEVVLALGVQGRLAGTAYLDDAIPEKWKAAYESVPVLSKEYPDKETLLAAQPDFLYASYTSAFSDKVAGTQAELAKAGVPTFLSPFGCEDDATRARASFESVWQEIDTVAAVFGVPDKAKEIRAEQQATLDKLAADKVGAGHTVFWFDSGDKTAFAGAGEGGPQLVISAVGATNVFADLSGNWADVSWEQVVKADPEVIVLADASWSTAAEKRKQMESDPVLSKLTAVKEGRFVTVPFSESTPGVRLVDGAAALAEQIVALGLS